MNIPRYVDTFEEETPIDMATIGTEIKEIRQEKRALEKNLFETISSLQFSSEDAEWIKGALEVFDYEE